MKSAALVFGSIVVGVLVSARGLAEGSKSPEGSALTGTEASANDAGHGSPETLDLQEAVRLTVQHDPSLKAIALEVRARDAVIQQAGARANPAAFFETENLGGTKDYSGVRRLESTLRIDQPIEMGNGRAARRQLAELDMTLAGWDREERRIAVEASTALRFVDVLAAQALVATLEEALGVSVSLERVVARRKQAGGTTSPAEQVNANLGTERVKARLAQAKDQLALVRVRLSMRWGETEPRFARLSGDFDLPASLPTLSELVQRLEQQAAVARWTSETAQRQAALSVEDAKRQSTVTLSGGLRYFNESRAAGIVLGASLPLPLYNANAGGIRQASERVTKAELEKAAVLASLKDELSASYTRVAVLHRELTDLDRILLPTVAEAFALSERAYRAGAASYLEVNQARANEIELKLRRIEAMADFHREAVAIVRLTGKPLF